MMGRRLSLAFAISVLVIGCGADGKGGGDDDGGSPQVSPLGRYAVRSEIRILTPPVITTIAGSFFDAAFDPPRWLCTTTAPHIPDAGLRAMVQAGCDGIVRGVLNDRLIQIAPDLATAFVKLDEGLPPVATAFGVRSELRVLTDGAVFVANHRVPGISFGDRVFALLDFGIGTNIATDIDISWSPPQLGIKQHFLPVPVGTVARIGLDKIVLPTIDGAATGLADLYDRRVDCPAVGQAISLAIGQGSPAVFAAACDAGLVAAGDAVYQQLDALDSAIDGLQIASTADASDTDGDGTVNRLTGSWTGTVIEQSKPPGSLAASFIADRL